MKKEIQILKSIIGLIVHGNLVAQVHLKEWFAVLIATSVGQSQTTVTGAVPCPTLVREKKDG